MNAKRILAVLLALTMTLAMGTMLFSCDDDTTDGTTAATQAATEAPTAAPHTCSFNETKWATDENAHWYACTVEGCTQQSQKADHSFDSPKVEQEAALIRRTYTCAVCGYEKINETTISSVVENQASWKQAFENLALVNFTLTAHFEQDEMEQTNIVEVSDTVVHYSIPGTNGREFYSVKNEDGTYTTYARIDGFDEGAYAGFYKLNDTSDQYFNGAINEAILKLSFADYYDKFTYDAEQGAYVYAGEVLVTPCMENGEPIPYMEQMICTNNKIKVADGKITHIEADYTFEDYPDTFKANLCYYNIGLTEVSVPGAIVENAQPEGDNDIFGSSGGSSSDDEHVQGNPSDGDLKPIEPEEAQTGMAIQPIQPDEAQTGGMVIQPIQPDEAQTGGMVIQPIQPDEAQTGGMVIKPIQPDEAQTTGAIEYNPSQSENTQTEGTVMNPVQSQE